MSQVSPIGGTRSDPWRVLDRVERPVSLEPCADRVVKHWVERRTVRAHPGTDGRMLFTRTGAVRAFAARRVDVHTADDFAGAGAEHGVGEPAALGEVLRVAFEVAQIFRQAHLVRTARPGESRRRLDVADAGRPCGIVCGVVLRPERFQPEFLSREPTGDREIHRNEELITHQAMLAGRPSHPPRPAAAKLPPRWPAHGTAPSGQPRSLLTGAVTFRESLRRSVTRGSAALIGWDEIPARGPDTDGGDLCRSCSGTPASHGRSPTDGPTLARVPRELPDAARSSKTIATARSRSSAGC